MIGTYLIDNATLSKFAGSDIHQEPATPVSEAVKVFFQYEESRIENAEGQMTVSRAYVLFNPRTIIASGFATRAAKTIAYEDKIIYEGITYSIVRIATIRDFSVRGLKVYVA